MLVTSTYHVFTLGFQTALDQWYQDYIAAAKANDFKKCSICLLKLTDGTLSAWVDELKPQSKEICQEILRTSYKKLQKQQDNALRLISKSSCNWERVFQIALSATLQAITDPREAGEILDKEIQQSKNSKERDLLNILIGKYRYSQNLAPIPAYDSSAICTPVNVKRISLPSTDTRPSKRKCTINSIGQCSEDNEKESTASSSQKSSREKEDPIAQIKRKTCTLFRGTPLNSNKFMFSLKKQKNKKYHNSSVLMAFCPKPKKHSPVVKPKTVSAKLKKTPTEGNHRKSSICEIIEFGTPQRSIANDANIIKYVPCHDLSKVFESMTK